MQIGNYKITKLDRRYNGHENFKFMAEPFFTTPTVRAGNAKAELFNDMRIWCWQQWGPACELHLRRHVPNVWCWESEYSKMRIYLQGDPELVLATMVFAGK
jgi:hypothetical protein